MKRKEYESPQTLIAEVETEACFCGSAIHDDEKSDVTSNQQEIQGEFTFGADGWKNENSTTQNEF